MGSVSPLLHVVGELMTRDGEKSEVFKCLAYLSFNWQGPPSDILLSQAYQQSVEMKR